MPIPLEDTFADIVGKAMRGQKLADSDVAAHASVSAAAVQSLRDGTFDEATARAVAPVLGLGATQLVAAGEKSWFPQPIEVAGLASFNTPFEDMTVNSYLAWDAASREAVAFDTGADCSGMLDVLAQEKLTLKLILLTHTHGDHIFDLDRLREKTGAPAFVGDRESVEGAEPFAAGRNFTCGALRIESRLTWGHSPGGITYVIRGLARSATIVEIDDAVFAVVAGATLRGDHIATPCDVAIVGDAVFAGSMGGGGISYPDALATNRKEILTLPDDTVLCPGHGPLTTVGEQKKHNPFFTA